MDQHAGNRGRSVPKTVLVALPVLVFFIVILTVFIIFKPQNFVASFFNRDTRVQTKDLQELRVLWDGGDYRTLMEKGELILKSEPLHFETILLTGFAAYYHASAMTNIDERQKALVRAVSLLRQTIILEPFRNNGDIFYILGKSYYALGYFYHDLALEYLVKAEKTGFHEKDFDEFLGVVYVSMGQPQKALEYFLKTLKQKYTDSVQLALTNTYFLLEKNEEGIKELSKLLEKAQDPVVKEKALFIKADLLMKEGKNTEALEYYQNILASDPNSADAHFYIGEIYQAQGDTAKARSEWRAAVVLDPAHSAAINRLSSGM